MDPNIIKGVAAFLTTKGATVRTAWLEATMGKLINKANIVPSAATLRQPVFDELLNANLCDANDGRLPKDIATFHKKQLSGPVLVQIETIIDVGDSLLHQLDKAEGREDPEIPAEGGDLFAAAAAMASAPKGKGKAAANKVEWTARPTRLLRLQLTDGVTEVKAMEYKTIPDLSNAKAGAKLIIQQVDMRSGMLLLRPENVTVVGGSVAAYADRNDIALTLRRLLKLENKSKNPIPVEQQPQQRQPAPAITQVNDLLAGISAEDLEDEPILLDDDDDLPSELFESIDAAASAASTSKRQASANQATEIKKPRIEQVPILCFDQLQLPSTQPVVMKITIESLLGKLEYEHGLFELHVAAVDSQSRKAELVLSDQYLASILQMSATDFQKLSKAERTKVRDTRLKPVLHASAMEMTLDLSCNNSRKLPAITAMQLL